MSHGPTYYESKGQCIYCGITDEILTDEHIVPLCLGGVHVLRKASCTKCAKITSNFERIVARDLWGDARISFDSPSRKKKYRPKIIFCTDSNNPELKQPVSVEEYPAGLVFYKMNPPGFLQGLGPDIDISGSWQFSVVDDDKRRTDFLKKYGKYATLKFRNVPYEFGQLLAKIGYGQILTVFHPSEFTHFALPYILGEKKNVSFIVGSSDNEVTPVANIGYYLNLGTIVSATLDRMILFAKVRLYANTYSPEYTVIVGEIIGKERVADAAKKIG